VNREKEGKKKNIWIYHHGEDLGERGDEEPCLRVGGDLLFETRIDRSWDGFTKGGKDTAGDLCDSGKGN